MKLIWAATMALGLVSCGPNGGMAQEQEKEQPVVQIEAVPDSELPTDGSMHVVKRGKFVITPDTFFCTYRPGFGLDGRHLSDALESLGQSDYLNGSPRTNDTFGPHGLSKACADGAPILIRVFQSDNRTGKPYRLTLAVRQGDALWQGIVERAEGGKSEIIAMNAYPQEAGPGYSFRRSLSADMKDLSKSFVDYISDRSGV